MGSIRMKMFKTIPLFGVILVMYMFFQVIFYYNDPTYDILGQQLFSIPLPSKQYWSLRMSDLIILMGLVVLMIEIVKSTGVGNVEIIEHVLSTFVALSYLIVFLMAPMAANSTFFILSTMSLIDVIAGITISITQARRDFHVG
jgi:hypothetical protein